MRHAEMKLSDDLQVKLKKIGVEDPSKLSESDIDSICRALVQTESLDQHEFLSVVQFVEGSARVFMEGVWKVVSDGKEISVQALALIGQATQMLGKQLDGNISPEERSQLLRLLEKLIEEARLEANSSRVHQQRLVAMVATALLSLAGLVVVAVTKRRP